MSIDRQEHGFSGKNKARHPLYIVWSNMIGRCERPSHNSYRNYGARGVTLCREWRENPVLFIEWALKEGWRKGLQIDRIDVNGHYEPGNCRVVDRYSQARNRRNNIWVTIEEKDYILKDAADKFSEVSYRTVLTRYRERGWTLMQAIFTPKGGKG